MKTIQLIAARVVTLRKTLTAFASAAFALAAAAAARRADATDDADAG